MSIDVPPFFHETPWFGALLASGLLALFLATVRFRERRVRVRAADLARQVRARTRDLEAEKRQTAEMLEVVRDQAEKLQALDEVKSRFFQNVTHELRTPLTLVLGPLEAAIDRGSAALPEDVEGDLSLARANGERLLELVDQLLDIARLEAGEVELRPTRGDVTRVLARATRAFEAHARARDMQYSVVLPPGPMETRFDPDALEKVVSNLLGNAFKYTPDGGAVSFRARVAEDGPDRLAIEVDDTGRGIPAVEIDRVFGRFHRTAEPGGPTTHGTGVGLSLVRELVDLQGGDIRVRSTQGHGSTFRVTIPLPPPPPEEEPRAGSTGSAAPPPVLPRPDGRPRDAVVPGGDGGRPAREHGAGDDLLALVIEDHADLRAWIRRHLESRFRVVEASDGTEGLERARALLPDVVISDVMMPGMDGEALCEALKTDPETDFVPVLLLTARSTRADRLSGLRHGADAYLVKPFDVEELLLTIDNVLAVRRSLRERATARMSGLPSLVPPWQRTPATDGAGRFRDHMYRKLAEHVSDEDLSVEDLAEAMGMSRSTLYRRIEEHLDESPMEIIWSYRLEQAAEWLRETDASVSEVAYGVGFKTVPHFSRRFRERFGVSPTTYRRT